MAAKRASASKPSSKRSSKKPSSKPPAKKAPSKRAAAKRPATRAPAKRAAKAPVRAAKAAAPETERVTIEIPVRGRKVNPEAMKTCGEMISRLAGGRPVVFTFNDRVVALATSYIRKGNAAGGAGLAAGSSSQRRPRVPLGMQLEWKRRGVDLQGAVDRARAVTTLEQTRLAFIRQGRTRDADALQDAIYAERAGIDTRNWDLPALIPSGRYDD